MKCEKCGKKIEYNRYKKVKGKYYCLKCHENMCTKKAVEEEELINVSKYTPDAYSGTVETAEEFGANDVVEKREVKPRKKYKKRKAKKVE